MSIYDMIKLGGQTWYLSPSGIAAVVEYLELKEAQESGRRGLIVAVAAIAISVLVGLAQIYFSSGVQDVHIVRHHESFRRGSI